MGFWYLACDGALDQNQTGYGGLLRDDSSTPLVAYVKNVDKRHVLVIDRGYKKLKIQMDSKLVVDVLNNKNLYPWS